MTDRQTGINGGEKETETGRKEKTLRQTRRDRETDRAETQRDTPSQR